MNYLRSTGYLVGRLHTSLLAHLIEESDRDPQPLAAFLRELGVVERIDNKRLSYQYEYSKIDLATWVDDEPLCAIEMKTDDCETPSWEPRQTQELAKNPSLRGFKLFFVTVADSQYVGGPTSAAFDHVTLERWSTATQAAASCSKGDVQVVLRAYVEEYEDELRMRGGVAHLQSFDWDCSALPERVFPRNHSKAPPRVTPYMAVLARVRSEWETRYSKLGTPRLYIHGRGKDTILNFSSVKHAYQDVSKDLYFEINGNGSLNAKIGTEGRSSEELRRIAGVFGPQQRQSIRTGNHVTLAQFQVGLRDRDGDEQSVMNVATRIRSILLREPAASEGCQ